MAKRAIYFGGVRLWEVFQSMTLSPASSPSMQSGLGREFSNPVPYSPNTVSGVSIETFINPVDAIDDLSREQTLQVTLLKMAALMADLQSSGQTHPVCSVDDTDRSAGVSGGPYAPGSGVSVLIDAPGGGWHPTANRYVLVRQPQSGVGFAALMTTATDSAIRIDLPVQIDATWVVLDCQWYVPSCVFQSFSPGTPNLDADVYRDGVDYSFEAYASPVYSDDYDPPMDDA